MGGCFTIHGYYRGDQVEDGDQLKIISAAFYINGTHAAGPLRAQWDTGSNITTISGEMIKELELIPVESDAQSRIINGQVITLDKYFVKLLLNQGDEWRPIERIAVYGPVSPDGCDILIGMNVIDVCKMVIADGKFRIDVMLP